MTSARAEHPVTKKDARNRPVHDNKTLVLSSPYVKNPVHYRYAWGRNPMGNLKPTYSYSSAVLATQRSDDWKIYEVPFKFGDKADRGTMTSARQVNRLFDMQRRINDAKRLIEENLDTNAEELKKAKEKWQ